MNGYQRRKARLIAGSIIQAACQMEEPLSQLPATVARFTHRQWISVSLAAGVPVAEEPCRKLVVALLLNSYLV